MTDADIRIRRMRIIAKERWGGEMHSGDHFLANALDWFNERTIGQHDNEDGCFSLQCSDTDLWIATFLFVYDKGDTEREIDWAGEGASALNAIVELLWDMRGSTANEEKTCATTD